MAHPAEKAGLQAGDVLAGINNTLNGNIQAYKNMLQTAGAKLVNCLSFEMAKHKLQRLKLRVFLIRVINCKDPVQLH